MEEKKRSRKRPEKPEGSRKISWPAVAAAGALAAAAAAGFYIYKSMTYRETFLPGTYINGQTVQGLSVQEVETMINEGVSGYRLTMELKGGETEELKGSDIGLTAVFDGSLNKIIEVQNPYTWPVRLLKNVEYTLDTLVDYDKGLLEEVLGELPAFDQEGTKAPVDASLSEYQEGVGYVIVPAEEGNRINLQKAEETVGAAVKSLSGSISFEDEGLYEEPAMREDNETLIQVADTLNRYVKTKITYKFGGSTEILDGNTIKNWLSVADNQVVVDEAAAAAYVEELAAEYDTDHKAKTLKTSYGPTIKVTGGSYGWRINQAEETKELLAAIASGETMEREPVYSQKAASRGVNDYGDTYVEINLTAQHLFYYVDGNLLVETDFVSGSQAKGYDTPAGSYSITYTQRNATLRGEDYETPVDYWMPFNGGIGLHDADWRQSFGGVIYKTNGSHGCVNLPPAAAKKIFENIKAGFPVLCYHLEGTEQGPSQAELEAAAAAQAAAASQSTESVSPAETQPVPEELRPTEAEPQPEIEEETPKPAEGSGGPDGQISTSEPKGPGYDNENAGSGQTGPGV